MIVKRPKPKETKPNNIPNSCVDNSLVDSKIGIYSGLNVVS